MAFLCPVSISSSFFFYQKEVVSRFVKLVETHQTDVNAAKGGSGKYLLRDIKHQCMVHFSYFNFKHLKITSISPDNYGLCVGLSLKI